MAIRLKIGEDSNSNITASASKKKDDSITIAILLNLAGEDAIEVFNTFQFPEGDKKKLDKVLEQYVQAVLQP